MPIDESQRTTLLGLVRQRLAGEQMVRTVLLQQAIGDRLGLNTTDLTCLYYLNDAASLTAGQLAEVTGLTTGSVTIVIDRLEKAGYVQRERDATDRRRVIVRPMAARIERDITPLYASLGEAWGHALEGYSADELATILDLLTRSNVLAQEQIAVLRRSDDASGASEKPRANAMATNDAVPDYARLTFSMGATNINLRGANLTELYHGRFQPPKPRLTYTNGVAQVVVRGAVLPEADAERPDEGTRTSTSIFAFLKRSVQTGVLTINATTTWQIEIRAGMTNSVFDLQNIVIADCTIIDGAYRSELNLGQPSGIVPIRITGGVADVTIRRPPGVATSVMVYEGATLLRLDKRSVMIAYGDEPIQTPDYANATDAYEIIVEGGASKLTVIS